MPIIIMLIAVGIFFTLDLLKTPGGRSQRSSNRLSEDEAEILNQYRNLRDRS